MEGPISSVVVEVPAMNFSRKFGDATEHITTRSDGGFDLQEDVATVLFFFVVHKNGGICDSDELFCASETNGNDSFLYGIWSVLKS